MRKVKWLVIISLLTLLTISSGLGLAGTDESFGPLEQFSQVLDLVESYYVKEIPRKDLMQYAIKGMLSQLDPHSAYLPKDDFQALQDTTSGEFSGIGTEIGMENGKLLVISPIEDTPAYKAGLLPGDVILEINKEPTRDLTVMDAVKKIRGPKGTSVGLTVLHKADGKQVELTIKRDVIPIVGVKTSELDDGYIYLRIANFNERTTQEIQKKLAEFTKSKPIQGIVMDLRNNPGGLLGQAVSVTDLFLSEGLIVYIQGRTDDRKDFAATPKPDVLTQPLVVLINAGSASASEIVAGALQDHRRALLVGEKTFGKGSVQNVYPMPEGTGIKLTTALYYTPSGRSIQAEGIRPDLEIPFVQTTEEDKTKDHSQLREQNLNLHLENPVNGNTTTGRPIPGHETTRELLDKDNQLRLALELVRHWPDIKKIQ